MFTSVPVSAALLIIGIALFIFMCFKGFNTAISAIICAMIVALGCADGWLETMFVTFTSGAGKFFTNFALLYLSSGLFAFLMRETRSADAVANNMVSKFGMNRAPIVIIIITAIIQIAGVSTYVLVAPIAIALCRASDLPVSVGFASCVGIPPLISFCLPGVTALPNVIPTTALGTSIYAAPLMGVVCAIIGLTLASLYLVHVVHSCRTKGRHFEEPVGTTAGMSVANGGRFGEIEVPPMWKGLLPLGGVLILAWVFQNVVQLSSLQAVCFSMWCCSLLIILLNWDVCIKQIKLVRIVSMGPMEIVPFLVVVACVYGFGSVTSSSACFAPLQEAILSINLNPYVTAFITIALVAALCADGIAGMSLWLGTFAETFLAMPGVNAAAMHRILVMSATTFDSLPHSGSIANAMALFQTNHKDSYGHVFVLTVCIPVIFTAIGVLMAIFLY